MKLQHDNTAKRLRYSQNFLKDENLIEQLVANSSINSGDVVYEIGPGKGIVTSILSKHTKKVIAIELDPNLAQSLKNQFQNYSNVKIVHQDFLNYILPDGQYKIFSNIPFSVTAEIIKKIFGASNPPEDCYLIIQKEAALKFAGSPYGKESLISVLTKPWFDFKIVYQFSKTDFKPEPNVAVVLLRITKIQNPLISRVKQQQYKDFVTYTFNKSIPNIKTCLKKVFTTTQFTRIAGNLHISEVITPTQLTFEHWIELFRSFMQLVDMDKRHIVDRSESKLRKEQSRLDKVHRTRTSKNWKREAIF